MMVSNIPLSQLTTSSEADSFSLVIWDGGDLVVSSESKLNLRKLRSDIDIISASQLSNDSTISKVDQQLTEITNKNSELGTSLALLANNFSSTSKVIDGSDNRVAEISNRLTALEQQSIATETKIAESELIAKNIKDGTLIVANDTNLSVSRNGAGNYILVDSDVSVVSLFPGLNVELNYNYQSGSYVVVGTIPELVSMFRDGRGIHVEGDTSGKMTISVKSDLVVSIGGLDVTEKLDGTYVVSPTASFIRGDANRGMRSERDPITGKFTLGLSQELMTKVGIFYKSGYGIIQNKSEFSLDTSEIPTLHSGRGITITEKYDSTNISTSTEYTATFDASTALIPPQPTVSSVYPITLESVEVDSVYNVKDLKFGLSSEFTNNLDNVISILQSGIDSLNNTIGELGWDNITEGMKLALACPMLKVFELATGQYEQSGLLSSNASPVDLELLKRYGPGKHTLSLNQDMLPYIAYSEIGSGTALDTMSDIDLFIPLQEKLRVELGDPSFTIQDSERGTKYRITSVGTEQATYQVKPRSQLPAMSYNMELLLSTATGSGWRNSYYSQCSSFAYPTGIYNSQTYAGMELMVTGGDCDFFCGRARAGQINSIALNMPQAAFTYNPVVKMLSAIETKSADIIYYDMTIFDGYSGGTYTARFRRLVGSKINMNLDYVFEEAGFNNPGWVRGFARLYANWKMNDRDLNIMLWSLGANNLCIANGAGQFFFGNVLKGDDAYIFTPSYLRTVGYTANIGFNLTFSKDNINYQTGMAKFKMALTGGSVGYSAFPVNLMLDSFTFPISYEFDIAVGNLFDSSKLFSDCCWGEFDELKYLRCGIDDQVIKPKVTTEAPPPTTTLLEISTTTEAATTTAAPVVPKYVIDGYVSSGYVS